DARSDDPESTGERSRHAIPFGDLRHVSRAAQDRRNGEAARTGERPVEGAHHHGNRRGHAVLLGGARAPALPRKTSGRLHLPLPSRLSEWSRSCDRFPFRRALPTIAVRSAAARRAIAGSGCNREGTAASRARSAADPISPAKAPTASDGASTAH